MEAFRDSSLSPRRRAEDLLGRLTLREKVGQLNQRLYGFRCYERSGDEISLTPECEAEIERWSGLGALYGLYRADPWSGRTAETGILPRLAAKAYNLVQRRVLEASRFGIPVLMSSEAPHGHQALEGYLLPVNLAMGASFAPCLVQEAFGVVGEQLKSLGVDLALLSMLDVLRDPRWGRSEECFGEDPFLCAAMAFHAAEGCRKSGVDVVAKHLCAQGQTTGGLNASPAPIGPRELREIHLPPAEAAVRAGARGFMAAYNEIDGVPCHANPNLLRGILREEWGFDGIVMADGTAIDRLDDLTGDNAASGALALNSGVDMSLWDRGFSRLEEAVERGLVEEKALDESVLRVLELKFSRGLFEKPFLEGDTSRSFSVGHYPQSLELARQSAVLLKNEGGLLPISDKARSIAVIGPGADDPYLQLGDYTPPLTMGDGATLRQGLERTAPEGVVLRRAIGCPIRGGSDGDIAGAVRLARECDLVILALAGSSSRFSGATFDINGAVIHDGDVQMDCGEGVDSASLALSGRQHELASAIFETGVPVVAVIIAGRPYAVADIAHGSSALIYSFYPGPWGGLALAEILFGKAAPGGRLPASLPRHPGQLPCYYNGKAGGSRGYCDLPSNAAYPFGFGLGYTRFSFSNIRLVAEEEQALSVTGDTSNAGDAGGWAVPMLYLRWLQGDVTPRVKELKAFVKIWLEPGEASSFTLRLGKEELSRWDRDMKFVPGKGRLQLLLEEGGKALWSGEATVCGV